MNRKKVLTQRHEAAKTKNFLSRKPHDSKFLVHYSTFYVFLCVLVSLCEKRKNILFDLSWYCTMKSSVRIFSVFLMLVSGCATFKTAVSPKPGWGDTSAILANIQGERKDLSLQQIRDTLITNSSRLTSLRAKADLALTTPDAKGPVRCTGLIVYQSPRSLRAIGAKFATTLFDMSSDGNRFWLYIPPENLAYTGASNTFHKIEALGISIFPGDMASLFNYREILHGKQPTLETWPAYWLLHMLEMDKEEVNVKGNLLIDRVNAEVVRCELFNPDGSVRLQALFSNYITQNDCRIPQKIDVRWPAYDTTLSITFSDIAVNGVLDPKLFTLTIPEGAHIIPLN